MYIYFICLCDTLICNMFVTPPPPPISRFMGWWGSAPRLAGDLRLIRGLFLACPHWHHTVPPTGCLWQPAHCSRHGARQWVWPVPGREGLSQAPQWGERTCKPDTAGGQTYFYSPEQSRKPKWKFFFFDIVVHLCQTVLIHDTWGAAITAKHKPSLCLCLSPTAPQQSDIWQFRGARPLTLWVLPILFVRLHPLQWCHHFWTKSQHHHLRSQCELCRRSCLQTVSFFGAPKIFFQQFRCINTVHSIHFTTMNEKYGPSFWFIRVILYTAN